MSPNKRQVFWEKERFLELCPPQTSKFNYIQLGTGATHTIDDFYNYFYKDHDE